MPLGDLILFEEASKTLVDGTHDLDTHTFKCALITNAVNPATGDTTPALGDYTEVTAGGSYVAGGITLAASLTEVGGVTTFDFTTNPSWAQQAGGPTNAYWALVYNDTDTGKAALGFVDIVGPVDLTATALTITWNASGFFTVTKV